MPLDQDDAADGLSPGNGRTRQPAEAGATRLTPERAVLSSELRAMIDEALATLPPGQRAVVDLRDVQQLDGAEVCNILGTEDESPPGTHQGNIQLGVVTVMP
jgi:DNA-directed RNA polymerase specialized sigma24 family protein